MITGGMCESNTRLRRERGTLICRKTGFVCTVTCGTGDEAGETVVRTPPNVLLLAGDLPDISGFKVASRLHQAVPHVLIIMVAVHSDEPSVLEALKAGACGNTTTNGVSLGTDGTLSVAGLLNIEGAEYISFGHTSDAPLSLTYSAVVMTYGPFDGWRARDTGCSINPWPCA